MTADELRILTEAIQAASGAYSAETAEMRIRRDQEESASAKSKLIKESAARAGQAAVQALGSFSTSLLSTQAGMSKYNSAISGAGNAALDIGKNFGVAGLAIGGFVKLLSMGAELVLKQNDAMIKAYDTLSEFGMTAKLTTTDILKIGSASGYTSHNLEIFTKNAVKVSTELAALTGSASTGTEAFGKLTKITQEQRNQYNRLGQSQEKVTQLQTDWVKITVQSGQSLSKNTDQMQKSSLRYIDSMNELAALTGINVEQQQESQRIAMQNENFNAYISAQDLKRQRLDEEADAKKGTVEEAALRAKSEEISNMIASKTAYATWITATASASMAAKQLEAISTNSAVIYTDNNASLKLANIDMDKLNRKMMRGEDARIDGMAERNKATQRYNDQYGELTYRFGESSREFAKTMGQDAKEFENRAKFSKLRTDEEIEAYKKSFDLQKKELETKKLGLGMVDIIKKTQNDQLTVELRARQAMDTLASTISGPVNAAFRGLTSAMNVFGRTVGTLIKWLGHLLPGSGISEAGKKIENQFRDPEDIKDRNKKAELEKEAIKKQISDEEALNKTKSEDYKNLADKEKKSKEALQQADANVLLARKREADAAKGTPEERLKARKDVNTALVDQSNAHATHEIDRKALGSAGVQNSAAQKILRAKAELAKLDAEIADNKKALRQLTGEAEPEEKDKTVDKDPEVIEARTALKNKEDLLIDKKNKAIAKQFEEENNGEKYSAEAFEQKYKTLADKKRFADKLELKLKPDLDIIAALKLTNAALEKATEEKLEKLHIESAKKADEEYNKKHGVTQGAQPVDSNFKGFSKETDKNITDASKKFGMDEKTMRGFVKMEAGYNGKMSNTGAIGIGQFIQPTWNSLAETAEGKEIGMKVIDKTNFRTERDPRRDERVNMMATALLAKNNAKLLEAAHLPITGENLYMIHNIGPGAINAMKGNAVDSKTLLAMKHNGMKDGQSPSDFVAMQKHKYNTHESIANNPTQTAQSTTPSDKKAKNGGLFNGPMTGYPVELHGTELVTPIATIKNVTKKELAQVTPEDLGTVSKPGKATPIDTQLASFDKFTTAFMRSMAPAANALLELQKSSTKKTPDVQSWDLLKPKELPQQLTPASQVAEKKESDRVPKVELQAPQIKETVHPTPADFARAANENMQKKEEEEAKITKPMQDVTVAKDNSGDEMKSFVSGMVGQLADKLDRVIEKLADSHDTQEKLLQSSRV